MPKRLKIFAFFALLGARFALAAAPPYPAPSLSFAGLSSYLAAHPSEVRNLDDLLDVMLPVLRHPSPLSYRALLIYESKSRQAKYVSVTHPRILLEQGDFVAALVGDPKTGDAYQNLEIMEFSPKEHRFHFHQIQFTKDRPRIEADVPVCNGCHQGRPIWAAYDLWPGVFGGNGSALEPREIAWLAELRKKNENVSASRYRKIGNLISDEMVRISAHFFGHDLTDRNADRIGHEIESSKAFPFYRAALAGVLRGCGVESLLPASLRAEHETRLGESIDGVRADTIEINRDERRAREVKIARQLGLPLEGETYSVGKYYRSEWSRIGDIRFLVDGQSIDPSWRTTDWAMSHEPGSAGSYNFGAGTTEVGDLFAGGVEGRLFGDLSELGCDELRAKSLEALAPISP